MLRWLIKCHIMYPVNVKRVDRMVFH